MNTEAEINWITEELQRSNDPTIIRFFKSFLLSVKEKPDAKRLTVEEYNKEIDCAESQIDSGNYTTQEDLEREVDKW